MDTTDNNHIWVDRVATQLGIGHIASVLPGSPAPSYVYIGCFVIFDIAIRIYQTVTGIRPILVNNPLWLLQEIALVGAVVAAKWLNTEYAWVIDRMAIYDRVTHPEHFEQLVSDRYLWIGFGLGAIVWWAFAIFVVTPAEAMRIGGPLALVTGLVIIPLGTFQSQSSSLQPISALSYCSPGGSSRAISNHTSLIPNRLEDSVLWGNSSRAPITCL